MTRSGDSLSRELTGVLGGLLGLCILAVIGVRLQDNTLARVRRSVNTDTTSQEALSEDYEVNFDDDEEQPSLVDDWSTNNTELWKQLYKDLHLELVEDDVAEKARRGQRGTNWNRLREGMLPGLHDTMVKEFYKRVSELQLYNEISGVDYGKRDPKEMGDDEENAEGDYKGYDKTAPLIRDFVDAFDCRGDGSGLWTNGNRLNFWYLFPNAIPLTASKNNHVKDYDYYWQFLMKFVEKWPTTRGSDIRFSLGTYGSSAIFTPRGYKFRKNVPWSRMQRFYRKPRMQAAQPRIFAVMRTLLTYLPRYGVSTASAGTNCVLLWVFQDVPKDINDFMAPESFEQISELNTMCTVVPIIISPVSDDRTDDAWKKFVANLIPGLQTKYAKDPEYSGAFYVNSLAGLMDNNLHEHIQKYLCLVQNRATCRTCENAYVEPASKGPVTDGPTQVDIVRGIEEDYEEPVVEEEEEPTEAPTEGGPTTAKVTPKTPEIDSCCGHNGYVGTPFDSELKTCCENGQVKPYAFEGDDPCLDDGGFIFRK